MYYKYLWPVTIVFLLVFIVVLNVLFKIDVSYRWKNLANSDAGGGLSDEENFSDLEASLFPADGTVLPIKWGNLGQQMVEKGVIDKDKFEKLYTDRGGIDTYGSTLLYGSLTENVKITKENAGLLLNLFWALGLANKNTVLEKGPMQDEQYGGAENFASTGGWSLANGDAMEHYSKHDFISLTDDQQSLVEKVAKGIYRPCCNNSTYFPDCNHGMAMLGFLELIASQGASEEEMYKAALALNTYWFPSNYLTVNKYLKSIDKPWDQVPANEILGINYSSNSGFKQILSQTNPVQSKGGGLGCGV